MNVGAVQEAGSVPRLNKTWKEIDSHIALGGIAIMIVIIEDDNNHGRHVEFISGVGSFVDEHESLVYTITTTTNIVFNTDNENGYPVYMTTDNIGDDHN